jgi:hypothetical protein
LRKEKDASPWLASVRNEKIRKNEKVERKKVERGHGAIVAGVKDERERRDERQERERCDAIVIGAINERERRDEKVESERREGRRCHHYKCKR